MVLGRLPLLALQPLEDLAQEGPCPQLNPSPLGLAPLPLVLEMGLELGHLALALLHQVCVFLNLLPGHPPEWGQPSFALARQVGWGKGGRRSTTPHAIPF